MSGGFQPAVSFGGPGRADATLRVSHPTLDPRLIARSLALRPKLSRRVGDRRRTPKGTLLPGFEPESFCSFPIVGKPGGGTRPMAADQLVADLDRFLDRLQPAARFLRELRQGGGQSELFVGWFFVIFSALLFEHALLAKLADLELGLRLDIYADAPGER